jgi:hypothetical protein
VTDAADGLREDNFECSCRVPAAGGAGADTLLLEYTNVKDGDWDQIQIEATYKIPRDLMIEESKHGLLACFNTDSNFGFVFANTFNRTDDHETSWTDSTYFYLTHNATDTLTLEQHSKFQDSQTKWKLDTATDGQ